MPIFHDIRVYLDESLEAHLVGLDPKFGSYRILKKSLDARKKNKAHFVYSIETYPTPKPPPLEFEKLEKFAGSKPPHTCIIGAGPAGLFAALRLVERGLSCEILERGKELSPRMRDISQHWRKGIINFDSNVCFGEGGAGTFSDGKLITRIKSPFKNYIMQQFVRFGAPEEILYLSNPHVGSNKIRGVIHNIVEHLRQSGCPVRFGSRAESFHFTNNALEKVTLQNGESLCADNYILATGHSAHDVYESFLEADIPCEAKSMAMGFRIEHPQAWINKAQYGERWEHPELPVANYKLTEHNSESGVGVYSFCMCPGGYVLPSSAQEGRMVVNGMSNYNHGSPFANSGIVVSIDKDHWFPQGPKQALNFQREIETRTQKLVWDAGGTREVPVQRAIDFLNDKVGPVGKSSCPSGVIAVNLRSLYPQEITDALCRALKNFHIHHWLSCTSRLCL